MLHVKGFQTMRPIALDLQFAFTSGGQNSPAPAISCQISDSHEYDSYDWRWKCNSTGDPIPILSMAGSLPVILLSGLVLLPLLVMQSKQWKEFVPLCNSYYRLIVIAIC